MTAQTARRRSFGTVAGAALRLVIATSFLLGGVARADGPGTETDDDHTPSWFKKGYLTSVGSIGMLPWDDRVGVRTQVERLGPKFFLNITPSFNHVAHLGDRDLRMSFGVPLRFELLDTRGATTDERFANLWRFHSEDWDSVGDFAKLIRYVTFGRKEDGFYFNLNAFTTATIGHGTILKRYNPNLSIEAQRVSLELDGHNDFVGGQSYINHIAGPNLVGGLVFIKPLSLFDRSHYLPRSFSLGFTLVADLDAPVVNRLDVADTDKDGRRSELLLGGSDGTPQYFATTAFAYGIDAELKVYKNTDKSVDLKTYVDLSFLSGEVPKACDEWAREQHLCESLFSDDPVTVRPMPTHIETRGVTSAGFTAGMLGRFTLGDDRNHALRARLEGRAYAGNYLPGYFDTFYRVQRTQYATSSDPEGQSPANHTKLRRILERDSGMVYGFAAELSYALWDTFEASLGVEWNTTTDDNAWWVHLGVPKNEYFSFLLTYQKRSSATSDFFALTENALVVAQARVFILPFLHINSELITPFGFGEDNNFEQIFDINVGLELSFGY